MLWLLGCVNVKGTDTVPIEATRTVREDWYRVDLEILFQIKRESIKKSGSHPLPERDDDTHN